MPDHPVFYFTRMVPAYRVPVLEHLSDRLGGRLIVCHGHPPRASSQQSMTGEIVGRYAQERLPNVWMRGETLHAQPFHRVFRKHGRPAAVLAEESPRSVSLPLLLNYTHLQRARIALWGHFSSNDRPTTLRHPADRYRLWLARHADACICYTEGVADLLRPHVPERRLFVARNTLDTDRLFALDDALQAEGRTAVRRRLGIPDGVPVVAFIGRLIAAKGTGRLLDTFALLRQTGPACLLVVGDGPERAAMERRVAADGLDGVRFLGAMPRWEDSAPYLYSADVMLTPGYLGLSVNHAFAFGLPVVSRAAPPGIRYHSPEAEYVRHGENGLLAASDDAEALADAVRRVLRDHDRFTRNARAYARTHLTIDRMVDGLAAAVACLEDPATP